MKKDLYMSVSLKQLSVIVFSSLLIASGIMCVRYTGISVATANIVSGDTAIIVDAGHGGADGGAQSSEGVLEKDINLSIALKVGEMLKVMGYDVIYTRESDDIPYGNECNTIRQKKVWDTHNRMSVIESNPGGIFLSIHQNYFTQSKYSGAQVFYSGNNAESKILAESIQRSIVDKLQPDNDRQVKKSGTEIYLLYHAKVPAVMVECGFLSNSGEALLLKDESYQNKMALSIIEGLTQYLNSYKEI